MIKQNKLLVTVIATAILGAGAVAVASKNLSDQSDRSKTASSSTTDATTKDTSWKDNVVNENGGSESASSAAASSSSDSSSAAKGSQSAGKGSSSSSSQSNTLTEDDFRSSDDLAYRMIALYGMLNGDASWKALQSAKGITMTRQSDSVPTFAVTATSGGNTTAYYRYAMTSNDTEAQKKPLSFSKNDASQYRASVADVLTCVNANGGRATIQKLNFKLVN